MRNYEVKRTVRLIADDLPSPMNWGMAKLRRSLLKRGYRLVTGDASYGIRLALADSAELSEDGSLSIRWLSPRELLIAGADARGLVYALTEVATAIELATQENSLSALIEAEETPELRWRSLQLFLYNATLEAEWFFREEFWEEYLGMLTGYRYNNLTLTFGHQTSYLSPPYPFFVRLEEFPEVRACFQSEAERERNLHALQRIAEMAQERGLHFTVAVWSQHDCSYGPKMVERLRDRILANYNAMALRRLLELCPAIDGVQFRLNVESGIPEEIHLEYGEKQFRAIAECGHPIRLDLRAKGLSDRTIEGALEIIPETAVSTKFWCEHIGQPYIMPAVLRGMRAVTVDMACGTC